LNSKSIFKSLYAVFFASCFGAFALGSSVRAQQPQIPDPTIVREFSPSVDTFTRGSQVPSWTLPALDTPVLAQNGPIQLLYSESQYLAASIPAQLQLRVFKINDQSGLRDVGQFSIEFVPAYEKLNLHSVKIIRAGTTLDKTASVNVRFLQREAGFESGIYSGVVTATLVTEDIRVGDVFSLAYSRVGANPVFGDRYSQSAGWDSGILTGLRRVVVTSAPERPIAWQMHGDTDIKKLTPQTRNHNGLVAQVFEESNVPALLFEPQIPSDFIFGRYLQFSEFKNWQEVAQWGAKLFPSNAPLPEEMLSQVKLWQALPTPGERAAAALRWVQDEIRYFSVSIGESSHRPHSPTQVISRRYGDCKDKTYLLNTLLQRLGIEAQPVLVRANGVRAPRRSMPTPTAFDHVVTRAIIDGLPYYFDATRANQRGPVEKLGWSLVGADGLVLADTTQSLIVIAPVLAQSRTNELEEIFDLPKFGSDANLAVTQKFYGLGAEAWRSISKQLTLEQRRRALINDYEKRYPGIRLDGDPVFIDDEKQNVFTVKTKYLVPNLAKEERGDWFFRFFPNNLSGSITLPQDTKRQAPALLSSFPNSLAYNLIVNWPSTVAALRDPASQRVSNEYFAAEVQRTFRGNVSTAKVFFENRNNVVNPKQLPAVVEDVRKLERLMGRCYGRTKRSD
jgi:transglutaminase-like putative cysteine protease